MSSRVFIALGTSSQVPTRERNHNGYFLQWDREGLLFDPGEGTQRQMTYAGISASDITKIFITHFHGDHCLGLPGIWQRLSLDKVEHTVHLFYPASGGRYVENLKNASIFHNVAQVEEHPVSEEGVVYECEDFWIETRALDHTAESWGYRIQERDSSRMLPEKLKQAGISGPEVGRLKREGSLVVDGRNVELDAVSVKRRGQSAAFVMDTRMCRGAHELARDVDLFVCESTYLSTETKDAIAHGHMTATQAAEIARASHAGLLALTHYSQRYKRVEDFAEEARLIHPNVVALKDGDRVELPKRS